MKNKLKNSGPRFALSVSKRNKNAERAHNESQRSNHRRFYWQLPYHDEGFGIMTWVVAMLECWFDARKL